jgi:hypothetical protein
LIVLFNLIARPTFSKKDNKDFTNIH